MSTAIKIALSLFIGIIIGLVGYVTYTQVAEAQSRDASKDFNNLTVDMGVRIAQGIWSSSTTMYVADFSEDKIFAYNLSTKVRDASKDFNTLAEAGNTDPRDIWSDGTTMYVADYDDDKIYAYNFSTKARDASKDFNTLDAAGNNTPMGLWSDGTTMWVSDDIDDKIYAYNFSTKARDASRDFDNLNDVGNDRSTSIWSDGTTMYVADDHDDRIYAYNLSTKARDPVKDFNIDTLFNENGHGIWSNGTTMYVADDGGDKILGYNFPIANDALLSTLSVDDQSISPGFVAGTTIYALSVPNDVSSITVAAMPVDVDASVSGTGARSLNVGINNVDIVVTARDGTTTRTYRIVTTRAEPVSTDASLSALAITGHNIFPGFTTDTLTYTSAVANAVSSITITATATDDGATIAGTGARSLVEGVNALEVVVTAEDGTTTRTYTINVTRRPGAVASLDISPTNTSTIRVTEPPLELILLM